MKKLLVVGVALLLVLGLTAVAGADFFYLAHSSVDNGTLNETYNLNRSGVGNIFRDITKMSGQKLSLDTIANWWWDGPDMGPGELFQYEAVAETGDRSVVCGYQELDKYTRARNLTLDRTFTQDFTVWSYACGASEPDKLYVKTFVEMGDFDSFPDPISGPLPEFGIDQITHAKGDKAKIDGDYSFVGPGNTFSKDLYAYTEPGWAIEDYTFVQDPW